MLAILGFSMRRACSWSERFKGVLLLAWVKVISSKVTVNASLLSVELLDTMDMASCLIRLPAVNVTSEDGMAAKSVPSVAKIDNRANTASSRRPCSMAIARCVN